MQQTLLVAWISTIGADRVNLLSGKGDLTLTPFLVLSPFVLFYFFTVIAAFRCETRIQISKSIREYLVLISIMLAIILLSVLFSSDIDTSGKRLVLLVSQIATTALVAIILYNHKSSPRILLMGAYGGILISLLLDIGQVLRYLGITPFSFLYNLPFVDLVPPIMGDWSVRLAGQSVDANRGGMLLVIYAFFVFKFGYNSKFRMMFLILDVFLLLLTFSRSAILAFLIMSIALAMRPGRLRLRTAMKTAIKIAIAFSILTLAVAYGLQRTGLLPSLDMARFMAERGSISEGSSGSIHLSLIDLGMEVSFLSSKNLLLGIGFGNSCTVLDSVFPGSEYANFHSMYMSYLVESGVFSLLIFLGLCIYPMIRRSTYTPIMIALMVFNVFYQLNLEPLFWFCLVLTWGGMKAHDHADAAVTQLGEAQ